MRTRFVAEVSSNHHRDLDRCRSFISTAAEIGCDAVKFQLFRVDRLFAPEALQRYAHLRERSAWELPVEFLPELAAHANQCDIEFSCTPFDLEAVGQLEPWVAFYKVASYELMWGELLRACARRQKPVVISTGMATLDEIDTAVATLRAEGCADPTLLHCVSGYPSPAEQCNLRALETLRRRYPGCAVGWSDHSVSPGVVHRAVHRYGASMIEFHLDLDRKGEEFATGHCWLPEQIGPLIAAVREAELADGDGEKHPAEAELPDREWRADPHDGLRPLRSVRQEWARLAG